MTTIKITANKLRNCANVFDCWMDMGGAYTDDLHAKMDALSLAARLDVVGRLNVREMARATELVSAVIESGERI